MLLVLVITVASLALADAGYQYNSQGKPLGVPGQQPANFQSGHGSQYHNALPNEHNKPLSHSISYKDYVYLRQDSGHGHGNHGDINNGVVAGSLVYPISGPSSNNGNANTGYAQNFAPTQNINLKNAENYAPINNNHYNGGYVQNFLPIVSDNGNRGYSQTSTLSGSTSDSLNTGYTESLLIYPATHLNNGHRQTSVPAVSNTPTASSTSNIVYSNGWTPSSNPGLSHGSASVAVPSSTYNLISSYSQTVAPSGSAPLSNGYSQSSASATLNTGYPQNLAPSGTVTFTNGYAQTSIPSPSGNIINSYPQAVSTSGSPNLYNGFSEIPVSSGNSNSNNGYTQNLVPYPSTSLSENNAQSVILPANDNINNGYSHTHIPNFSSHSTSNGHSGLSVPSAVSENNSYNTGYSHYTSSDSAGTSNGLAQTATASTGAVLNAVYSQPATSYLSSEYSQSSAGGEGLNSGYSQPSVPQYSTQLHTAYGQPVSSSLNNVIVQTSTSPLKIDLHPSSTLDASINNVDAQTSTGSATLNIGFTQTDTNSNYDGNANSVIVPSSAPVTPAVFKHIYFHAPPPELEEQQAIPPPPLPKKNYKILFIKVPSQESNTDLKQIAEASNAATAVEHKTLIYVLVKNSETQQPIIIPKYSPSEHEVFFVNYNGDPLDLAAAVNDELNKSDSVQSVVPLEPGLVNGKK